MAQPNACITQPRPAQHSVAQPATVSVDMAAVKARIGRTIGQIYDADDSPEALRALGIETVSGAATLVDARRVSVSSGGGGNSGLGNASRRHRCRRRRNSSSSGGG